MRKALSFDVDGVLAGGSYVPRWDRTPEYYLKCPITSPLVPGTLNRLAAKADVYIVSSRAFGNACITTRQWLAERGVDLSALAGVVVGLSPPNKVAMINLLGSELHFDDDPRVAEPLGRHALLVDAHGWPENATSSHPRVKGWRSVEAAAWRALQEPAQLSLIFENEQSGTV